jgi:hypothetical protein
MSINWKNVEKILEANMLDSDLGYSFFGKTVTKEEYKAWNVGYWMGISFFGILLFGYNLVIYLITH